MFGWLKGKSETPAEVAKASALESDIRDQLDLDGAESAYIELAALAKAHPQYPDIRRLQANAAINLLRRRTETRTTADRVLLEEVQALAAAYPAEGIIRECLVHLAWEYMAKLRSDRIDEIAAIQERQSALYEAHPEVRKHPDPVVRSAMKLMTDYLIVGDIANARRLYDHVVALADQHLDDFDVQYTRCGAAHNLISRLATVDDMGPDEMELARGYFRELESFVAGSPFKDQLSEIVEEAGALVD